MRKVGFDSPRSEEEIEQERNAAADSRIAHHGSQWPGMSYEEGVEAALDWVLGNTDDKPIEE